MNDQPGISASAREPKRFGPYAIVREGPISEGRDVIGLFPSEPPHAIDSSLPTGIERRRSARIVAREHRLWVGWWVGPNQFHTVGSFLDNISQGGARVLIVDPPPKDQLIWLCLGNPTPAECVSAKVLEVIPLFSGDFAIRVAFGSPCPSNFYRIAIQGVDPQS
jgi:hypothetical protein